jgi:hypothetical protein
MNIKSESKNVNQFRLLIMTIDYNKDDSSINDNNNTTNNNGDDVVADQTDSLGGFQLCQS